MVQDPSNQSSPRLDVEELILSHSEKVTCETFIFEPSPEEVSCGFMFVAAETAAQDGLGKELVNTIVTAIQKEYYRDPRRSPETSFEMALHQANLILHDAAEQGLKEWMNSLHVSVAVLIENSLFISIAGAGAVLLARKSNISDISEGLSQSPITSALETFSQMASGDISSGDVVFVTTPAFKEAFKPTEITESSSLKGSVAIGEFLRNLYGHLPQPLPLATVVVSFLSQSAPTSHADTDDEPTARRDTSHMHQNGLRPRKPLIVRRSTLQNIFFGIAGFFAGIWRLIVTHVWPTIRKGSVAGGRAARQGAIIAGSNIKATASSRKIKIPIPTATSMKNIPQYTSSIFQSLPRTSKIFAAVSVLLLVALATSLLLLQQKRTSDTEIERASEILHEAQTKKDAAETALIYDNREQAATLLSEAEALTEELAALELYGEEVQQLATEITIQQDRIQRITRIGADEAEIIGDVGQLITGDPPTNIFAVNEKVYTFNPETNAIVEVAEGGNVTTVRQQTQGIGFFSSGAVHDPDKTITLGTDPAGIAVFDSKDSTLISQDIQFPSDKPEIRDIAVFGNRLYVYDKSANNIFLYNKTLRGYSGQSPWITDEDAPKESITSFTIDGNIFTLHEDGTIRRFFKGELADFVQATVAPSLATATKILTHEDWEYVYVLDPPNKRVVLYEKTGALVQQFAIDAADEVSAISISQDESTLYVLDGTRILGVPLTLE